MAAGEDHNGYHDVSPRYGVHVPYDAIVFDMDGVLLTGYHTDRELYRQAAIEALADFDASISRPPPGLIDPEDANHVRRLCKDVGVPADARSEEHTSEL